MILQFSWGVQASMDRRRASKIVSEIYIAAVDPRHWKKVVSMIAKLTHSQSACLCYKNKSIDIANMNAQYGLSDEIDLEPDQIINSLKDLIDSKARSPNLDATIRTQLNPGIKNVMSDSSDTDPSGMKLHNPYYIAGTHFSDSDAYRSGLAILRDKDLGAWSNGELRVIDEILPHLRHAFTIHSEITYLRFKQDALHKGLDRLVIGLILYDNNAKPIYLNPTAKTIIESHPALEFRDGDMFLTDQEDKMKLRQSILDTAKIDPDDSWKQSIAIGITHPEAQAPLPLLVTSMHANLMTSDLDYGGAKVAVFLTDPNLQQPISIDALVSVYGLTPSEAQVSISLANGQSIGEIAKTTSHSIHTLRTHLKAVYRKTHVSSQKELIKLLLTGPFAQRRRSKLK